MIAVIRSCDVTSKAGLRTRIPLGRQRLTEYMRHFLGIALLDGNIFARDTIDIDRRRRPGNKKWNAVAPRQHRDRVSADLVCHVAIGGDSVTADDYRVDSPLLHKITSHTVGNQRRRDLFLFELPGRESGTLQERPRFIDKNFKFLAGLFERSDHAQRRAVTGGGKRAGVAVRHDLLGVAQEAGAVFADLFVRGNVFFINFLRFVLERSLDEIDAAAAVLRVDLAHPTQRPKQVHRGGTSFSQY